MSPATAPLAADWLADPRLVRLFRAVEQQGDVARVVGGAVRNTLMGLPVADIDVATTALPELVMARAAAAGLRAVPTGIAHGTVTVIVAGHPFEVTTLREDVETHGRHATVVFGHDWVRDAERRDFTVNALYVGLDGRVLDAVGGVADCAARRIRFIGHPEDRIREDYLRILRFFRFHAAYGHGAPDAAGLAACAALQAGIGQLSAERLGAEMKKLVIAPGAAPTLAVMAAAGILARVLDFAPDLAVFSRLQALADRGTIPRRSADASLFLAALAYGDPARAEALALHLRLSNAERDRMNRAADPFAGPPAPEAIRALRYRRGAEGARDALILAAARDGAVDLPESLALADAFTPPALPVRGHDLLALGLSGPRVGEMARLAERLWIDSDFQMDRAALLTAIRARALP